MKTVAQKSYHKKLLDTVSGVPHLINKAIVRQSISKIRNGNVAGQSGVEKGAGEAGANRITDLVNQIIVERVTVAEW